MSKLAEEAYADGNFLLAVEIYERYLHNKQYDKIKNRISYDLYYMYGDSLAHSGRLKDAFEIYNYISNCMNDIIPLERLKNLSICFIDNVIRKFSLFDEKNFINNNNNDVTQNPEYKIDNYYKYLDPLLCPVCENVFQSPVTTSYGITFCRECYQRQQQKNNSNIIRFKPDVLIRRLVDKWWGTKYVQITELNGKAYDFMKNNQLDEALKFSNESLQKCSKYTNSLLIRSEILYKLKHYQSSLADAENALSICPISAKAYYRKGIALSQLGKYDEALLACCLAASLDNKFLSFSFKTTVTKLLQSIFRTNITNNNYFRCHSDKPYSRERKLKYRKRLKFIKNINQNNCGNQNNSNFILENNPINDCDNINCNIIDQINNSSINSSSIKLLLDRIQQEIIKVKSIGNKISFVHLDVDNIDASDFDCVLCCRTLWKPVVTPCGHTYCWVCLDRCMDYSSLCPLCMSPLIDRKGNDFNSANLSYALMKKSVTQFLEIAMQKFIPEWYDKRYKQETDIEPLIPVFICTTAFPQVPCPLFVYEPRYRLMVRRAVDSGKREFGIVQPINGKARYSEIGTMLNIKDSVMLSDGCSILSTIACKRFKIISRHEKDGYETAKVEYIYDDAIPKSLLPFISTMNSNVLKKAKKWFESLGTTIKEEVLRSFGSMPQLEANWDKNGDGPAWAWWTIAILPLNQQLKLNILANTSLEKRLRAIGKTLDYLTGRVKNSQPNCVVVPCDGLPACQAVECCQQQTNRSTSSDESETVTDNDSNYML